jgi:hypothetical protein
MAGRTASQAWATRWRQVVIEQTVGMGTGSIRVGRFVGRLGMVPMPAIEHGLGLVDRVVRRHVAKLEKAGWCQRMPTIRGDGMLVWLTPSGLDGVGLTGLRAVRAPGRFSPQTSRGVRVAWAAADIERAGHQWITNREMASEPNRWGAHVANERGGLSRRLPDLAFRPASDLSRPVAVIVIDGQSNPLREQAALAGWQRSIATRQYQQVQYMAGPGVAAYFRRLATEIGLTAPQFIAGDHVMTEEPPPLPPVIELLDEAPAAVETATVATPQLPQASAAHVAPPCPRCQESEATPERTAEQQRLIDQVLGHEEPPRRRRWGPRAS